MRNKNREPKRILVVKLADLGDALMITPALRALKATYPEARLEVLTTGGGPALEGLPYVDRVIFFNKYRYDSPREALQPANLLRAFGFLGQLTLAHYDTVIFFHHFTLAFGALKFAGLGLATLAPLRLGLDKGRGQGWFLSRRIKDRGFGAINEREYWLELVATLGAKLPAGDPGKPELFVTAEARQVAQEIRDKLGRPPLVVLAPGGGNYSLARRWFPVGFAAVADTLIERYGVKVLLMGNGEEVELAQEIRKLVRHPEEVSILAGSTSVAESVALLEQCELFIGNDGGLAHLAAVAGLPGVVIFGPTNAQAWKPFGQNMAVVVAPVELPCRPCLYRGFKLGSRYGCAPRPCLTFITPAQVVEAAEEVWKTRLKLNPA
ncbi:MAG: glycosyltransferase family 9 protein [Chloroflexi bacterium]|nr:glycosyltransferase family 9 protein [Chloroflexota bacterium]